MRLTTKPLTAFTAALVLLASAGTAHASEVDAAVVDVTTPVNAVTLAPGSNAPITINFTVSGAQAGTATFDFYRDWTLSGGVFTGTNAQEFSVPARSASSAPNSFSTTGTVAVALGQGAGTFTLAAQAFDVTNSNREGAKLRAGAVSSYAVTVSAPAAPPANTAPSAPGTPVADVSPTQGGFTLSWTPSADSEDDAFTYTVEGQDADDSAFAVVAGGLAAPSYTFAPGEPGEGTWTYRVKAVESSTSPALASQWGPESADVVVDRTGPAAPIGSTDRPADHLGADGQWWMDSVTVTFADEGDLTLADGSAGSGVAGVSPAQTFAMTGPFTGLGTATDHAGNASVETSFAGFVDADGPSLEVTCPSGVYFGQAHSASWTASDVGSGLTGADVGTLALDTESLGAKSVSVSVADRVGHETSATCSYTVHAWTLTGFYQPVDMSGIFNTVKAGATVPLKFGVAAGTTPLTSVSAVKSFVQTRIACDGSAPSDEIEVTSTGGTSLRYDLTAGHFIQNWQTPKVSGACYRVTMTTQDGSSTRAFFRLR